MSTRKPDRTATLHRELKRRFPETSFEMYQLGCGNNLNIRWHNGPDVDTVKHMTDVILNSWLPVLYHRTTQSTQGGWGQVTAPTG